MRIAQSATEFIREKHKAIYQRYLDLTKAEFAENHQRALHIGKLYYAKVIACEMQPPMSSGHIMRIINNQIRSGGRY